MLRKEDLIEGEIYIYDHKHISTYPVGPSLAVEHNKFEPLGSWIWNLDIEEATASQKLHLKQCAEANGFVLFSDVSPVVYDTKFLKKVLKRYNIK